MFNIIIKRNKEDMKVKAGVVLREKRLIPVTTPSNNKKLDKILSGIKRSTLRDEILVCVLASPDGKEGVFLDDTGREYLITEKELQEKLQYISSKYVRKEVMHYAVAKKSASEYEDLIKKFLEKPDTPKRYKGWTAPDEFKEDILIEPKVGDKLKANEKSSVSEELESEDLGEEQKYKKGQKYKSKDGKWKFEVISAGKMIKIRDLKDKKIYNVELSDIELARPILDEEVEDNTELNESKVAESGFHEGDLVEYNGKKYTYGGYYEQGLCELEPLRGKKECILAAESNLKKIDEELNEEFNPFKDMVKEKGEMRKGLYTDGMGGVYSAPKNGLSRKIKLNGKQYAYDFKKREIICYDLGKEIQRMSLQLSNWLDGPEYWCEVFENELCEEKSYEDAYEFLESEGEKIAKGCKSGKDVEKVEYDEDNWGVYVYFKGEHLVVITCTPKGDSILIKYFEEQDSQKPSKQIKFAFNAENIIKLVKTTKWR